MLKTIRRLLLKLSVPIQKLMQRLHVPDNLITEEFAERVVKTIQTGDVLLTRERWHFTNLFIPGYWSHAALYVSMSIFEADSRGVTRNWHSRYWIYNKDFVLHLRPKFKLNTDDIITKAVFACGLPYDYEFSSGIDSFYCSELVWYLLGSPHFTMRETFGVLTVTPQDFENAKDKFEVINDSRGFSDHQATST